jgi:hypothetical protein
VAVVVYVVANILSYMVAIMAIMILGDGLYCVFSVTEASAIQSYLSRDAPEEFESQTGVETSPGQLSFDPDLRYAALTKTAVAGSNGACLAIID